MEKINSHNKDSSQTHQEGVNQFTDLTQEEFAAKYLTLKVNKKSSRRAAPQEVKILGDVDWVAAKMVTAVKDQGQCGSCWAFSAVAAIESAVLINDSPEQLFSEQQLVDCSGAYGNEGCDGGWMDAAFEYVIDNGIATSAQYPYVARDQACKMDGGNFTINNFIDVQGCNALANALNYAPVSVAVDASNWSPYRSGVLSTCGNNVNHGVLLVGQSDAYWKIKNSWSTNWGESGYIRLAQGNTCDICEYPSLPQL